LPGARNDDGSITNKYRVRASGLRLQGSGVLLEFLRLQGSGFRVFEDDGSILLLFPKESALEQSQKSLLQNVAPDANRCDLVLINISRREKQISEQI